jgi:predicted DNA-binding transcriptional regulator AlpA
MTNHSEPVATATATTHAQSVKMTRLLWGWPELLAALGIPRRSLEREILAGRFPKPLRRIGRRPFWSPDDIRRWAAGDQYCDSSSNPARSTGSDVM